MTREREDQLLAEMRQLRQETSKLVQRIVEARMRGERDDDAIDRLATISDRKVELTRPDFEVAA